MYFTHSSSLMPCTLMRRFEAYVVPHGPRQPCAPLPISQSFSGTLLSFIA